MEDIASQESVSTEYSEPTGADTTPVEQDHSTGEVEANPFWGEVEKLTGPNVYKLIQPHLTKADEAARARVTSVNQSYAPWKELADQNITPDHVKQAMGIVQQLNDPEGQLQIYTSLQNFLRENGRLPDDQELQEQVDEDTEEDQPDPRYSALEQQNQAIMQFLQERQLAEQQQVAAQEADTWLDSERTRLQSKGYDDEDIKEIVRIAAASLGASGKVPDNFDAAAAHFDALRDRIRTTPRAGQLAPRLPSGPGGGTPTGGAIDPSNMSKDQRRELVAAMLQRGK